MNFVLSEVLPDMERVVMKCEVPVCEAMCVLLDKSHNWPANNSKAISLAPGHNSSFFSIS